MKKIIPIIALVVAAGGGYYGYKNFYKTEQQKAVQAIYNTFNQDNVANQTVVNLRATGFGLTDDQRKSIENTKVGVRTMKENEKKETYLTLVGQYYGVEVNTNVGMSIDAKNEVLKVDVTSLLKTFKELKSKLPESMKQEDFEEQGTTKEEVEEGLEELATSIKERIGEENYKTSENIVFSATFDQLKEEHGYTDEEIQALKDEVTGQKQIDLKKINTTVMSQVLSLLDKKQFKERPVTIKLEQFGTLLTQVMQDEGIKKAITTYAKDSLGKEIKAKEYDETVKEIPNMIKEAKKSFGIKEIQTSFDYDRDKKNDVMKTINTNIGIQLEDDKKVEIQMRSYFDKEKGFTMAEGKELNFSLLNDLFEGQSDLATNKEKTEQQTGFEEEKEDEVVSVEYEDEVATEEDGITDGVTDPLQFLEKEKKQSYVWDNTEEIVAGDGNTYVNYDFKYEEKLNAIKQHIVKQNVKGADGKERTVVYEKTKTSSNGTVTTQRYDLLWGENGEYHSYRKTITDQVTGDAITEAITGTYDANGKFKAINDGSEESGWEEDPFAEEKANAAQEANSDDTKVEEFDLEKE